MLLQLCSLGDGSDAEKWFERGGGSSSSVRSWLQLSDFFGHLKMFNLCITAALKGLRLVDDDTSLSFRLRLCLHVSESHSNLGNVSEAIRFINVAMQDIMTSIMRRKRKDKKLDGSEQDVESALSKAFDRFNSANCYFISRAFALDFLLIYMNRYKEKQERLLRWKFSLSDSTVASASTQDSGVTARRSPPLEQRLMTPRPATPANSTTHGSLYGPSSASLDSSGSRRATYSSLRHDDGPTQCFSAKEAIGAHIALLAQISWVHGNLNLSMRCCIQISGKRYPVSDHVLSEVRLCTSRCLMELGEYSDCLVQLGLSGNKTYNMQAMLEFCVCLVKCGSVDKAHQILLQMIVSPSNQVQQELQARLISGRIGSLKILRDLDIVFAKCIMSSSIRNLDRLVDEDVIDEAPANLKTDNDRSITKLISELCSRCGTSERGVLPRPQELLYWCLDQHFDQNFLDDAHFLDTIAFDIKQQEEALKDNLIDADKSLKMKEDSEKQVLAEVFEKFEGWKQLVETW